LADQVNNEVLEILTDRGATYALLSQLFREEVSAVLLEQLVTDLVDPNSQGDGTGQGYGLLRQFALSVRHRDLDEVRTELSVEFGRLFLTGRDDSVFPYESVYTSQERLLMQRARDEVLAAYRDEGLAKTAAFREPEDHLAVELDFMARLCQKTVDALAEGQIDAALALLDRQRAFLDEHLLVWVPRFSQDLAQAASSDFYRGVAVLTQEHLAQEGATIDELRERSKSYQASMTDSK
jgi:TorA maturation chaperone TorD